MGIILTEHPEQQKKSCEDLDTSAWHFIFNQCYLWCGTSDHPE